MLNFFDNYFVYSFDSQSNSTSTTPVTGYKYHYKHIMMTAMMTRMMMAMMMTSLPKTHLPTIPRAHHGPLGVPPTDPCLLQQFGRRSSEEEADAHRGWRPSPTRGMPAAIRARV